MLDTTQTATVLDEEGLQDHIKAFVKESFPDISFTDDGLSSENGLTCVTFYTSNYSREVSQVLSQIDDINVVYDEISAWSASENEFIAVKDEFLIEANYDNSSIGGQIQSITMTVHFGNIFEVTTAASKLAQKRLSSKLKNEAQALMNLMLRNKNHVVSETLEVLASGLKVQINESDLDDTAHDLMLVNQLAHTIKQANIKNQLAMVSQLAPNISHVSFDSLYDNDMKGEHFQTIDTYTVHLVDGTKIVIGYEDIWNDDFNNCLVDSNTEVFPKCLVDKSHEADTDDVETMNELTRFVATLFGSDNSHVFWFVCNRLDSLIWDAASEDKDEVVFANYQSNIGQ